MLGYLLFLIYLLLGVMMAAYLLPEKRLLVRLWVGFVLGIVALMWSNILFSFLLGFGKASHFCGLGLTVLITCGLYFFRAKKDKKPLFEKRFLLD